jgi:Ser/Thr protein kinase RdoA (MazF antagonist)
MVVTALPVVAGTTYDDDELTPELARLWGCTLARFHDTGYVHGDPEPDNLVIEGDGDNSRATFVDLDDAGPGDPVEDLAFALRAWTPPGGVPGLECEVPRAFLDGYRDVRDLFDADLARLPAAAHAVARRTLESYDAHAATPADSDWPDWARRLHATVAERAAELRSAL